MREALPCQIGAVIEIIGINVRLTAFSNRDGHRPRIYDKELFGRTPMLTAIADHFRPFFDDPPGLILFAAIYSYAAGLGIMLLRARGKTNMPAGLLPRDPFERRIWPLWFPLLGAWFLMPGFAIQRWHPWLAISDTVLAYPGVRTLRWMAATGVLVSLCAVIWCWMQLGRNWRVGVLPGKEPVLIRQGPYRFMRHPIYAFSMLLVLCSIIIVPTLPMAAVALPHIIFMLFKSHREERLLHETHGQAYAEYCKQTGRFLPRLPL